MNLVLKTAIKHRLNHFLQKLYEGKLSKKEHKEAELLAELQRLYNE